MSDDRVSVSFGQRRLAGIWVIGAAMISVLLIVQTMGGKYGTQYAKAWAWFLPTILPTLSIILGSVAHEARKEQTDTTASRIAFQLALGMSLFYLVLVLSTLLLQPFSSFSPLELMTVSHFWLGPVQGLVDIMLGVFFASREG